MKKLVTVVLLAIAVVVKAGASEGVRRSADDLFEEAKVLSTHEKWADAITRFRQFLRTHADDPRASEAQFWVGYCLVKSDEFDDAIRELRP